MVHAYLSSKVLCSSCPQTPPPVLQAVFEFLEYAILSPEAAFTLGFTFCIFHTLLHRVHFLHGCSDDCHSPRKTFHESVSVNGTHFRLLNSRTGRIFVVLALLSVHTVRGVLVCWLSTPTLSCSMAQIATCNNVPINIFVTSYLVSCCRGAVSSIATIIVHILIHHYVVCPQYWGYSSSSVNNCQMKGPKESWPVLFKDQPIAPSHRVDSLSPPPTHSLWICL